MRYEVADVDTAAEMGSGNVDVLATPRLIAWMEAATVQSAQRFIGQGQTTVGTAVRIEHRRATRVGDSVEVTAEPPSELDGRRLTFTVRATDISGDIVAAGEIDRAIVDLNRFFGTSHPEADQHADRP